MTPKWGTLRSKDGRESHFFLPPRSFSVDPEYDSVSLQPDVTDIMHAAPQRQTEGNLCVDSLEFD